MVLIAASGIVRDGLGSQVAVKLALEHFTQGAIEFLAQNATAVLPPDQLALEVIENSFRRANTAVYSFGHKLAAGGRMAAALQGLVIANRCIAAGRVGPGSAYLLRGQEIFPFFAISDEERQVPIQPERCVGAQSLVSVELASVELEPGDLIVMVGRFLNFQEELLLQDSAELLRQSAGNLIPILEDLFGPGWFGDYAGVVRVGEAAIYLARGDQLV
jgi:hypothetical protein